MTRLVSIALEIADRIERAWGAVEPVVRDWAAMYGKTFDQVRAAYEHRLKVIAADGPRPPSHDSPELIRQQIDHFAAIKGAMDEIAQGKATSENVRTLRSSAEALQRMWDKSVAPQADSKTKGGKATSLPPPPATTTAATTPGRQGQASPEPFPPRPWQPCDDGLTPIAEALDRFVGAKVIDLPKRIQYSSTQPSHELANAFNEPGMGPGTRSGSRREMVRRWLQFHGCVADAAEFDKRLQEVLDDLRAWQERAMHDVPPPDSTRVFSDPVCEAYDAVTDKATETCDYLRQLAAMINIRMAATAALPNCNDEQPAADHLAEMLGAPASQLGNKQVQEPLVGTAVRPSRADESNSGSPTVSKVSNADCGICFLALRATRWFPPPKGIRVDPDENLYHVFWMVDRADVAETLTEQLRLVCVDQTSSTYPPSFVYFCERLAVVSRKHEFIWVQGTKVDEQQRRLWHREISQLRFILSLGTWHEDEWTKAGQQTDERTRLLVKWAYLATQYEPYVRADLGIEPLGDRAMEIVKANVAVTLADGARTAAAREAEMAHMMGWEKVPSGSPSPNAVGSEGEKINGGLLAWTTGQRVTLAIVFTDIVGSTALARDVGDECMNEVRRLHFAQTRRLAGRCKGRQIKTTGDGVLAAFKTASDALDFACALQADTGHPRLKVRSGVHVGEVEVTEDDVLGITVDFTKRVEDTIEGAEIWLSDRAKEDVDKLGAARHRLLKWSRHDGRPLHGFSEKATLWSLETPPSE